MWMPRSLALCRAARCSKVARRDRPDAATVWTWCLAEELQHRRSSVSPAEATKPGCADSNGITNQLPAECVLLNHQEAASESRCSRRFHWRPSRTGPALNTSANQYAFCRHLGWIVVPLVEERTHPSSEYKNWLEFDPRDIAF